MRLHVLLQAVALLVVVFENDTEDVETNASRVSSTWRVVVRCAMCKRSQEHNTVLRAICDTFMRHWDPLAKLAPANILDTYDSYSSTHNKDAGGAA